MLCQNQNQSKQQSHHDQEYHLCSTLSVNIIERSLLKYLYYFDRAVMGQEQISSIPGAAGRDYPNLTSVPRTSFTCKDLSPGYYSDPEAQCQVYHRCTHGADKPSFTRLCPIGNNMFVFLNIPTWQYSSGTLYNQQYFTCDWWFNVDCSTVTDFYSLNDDVYAASLEAGK